MPAREHVTAGASQAGVSLLERDAELLALESTLAVPPGGDGALELIEGPPGIGKTALLDRARAAASEHGLAVLSARAAELESDFAYGVVRQLLESPLAAATPRLRTQLLAGAARPAELVLGAPASDTGLVSERDPSFGVLHGLYWLTANLAARAPLLLLVDDAQWCDRPSLRFLVHLAQRLDGVPIAVVVASRAAGSGPESQLLEELRVCAAGRVIEPDPLSAGAVEALVRQELGPDAADEFCRVCHRASAGNPFYIRELLRVLATQGVAPSASQVDRIEEISPDTVQRHVIRRLTRVGAHAPRLACAMAVLGEGPLALAARVAALDLGAAADTADALVRGDVLARANPFAFIHPVVRGAIAADAPDYELDRLHLAVARELADDERPAEEIAAHLQALAPAGRDWSVEILCTAAGAAAMRGAPDVAAGYLRRALAEPPSQTLRGEVLHELATSEEMIADERCVEHFTAARDAASEPALRAERSMDLANALIWLFRAREGIAVLEHELDNATTLPNRERELLESQLAINSAWDPDAAYKAGPLLERLAAVPPRDPAASRLALAARAWQFDHPAVEVAALAREALASDASRTAPWMGRVFAILALIRTDHFTEAQLALSDSLELAAQSGNARAIGTVQGNLGELSLALGDLAACEMYARTGIAVIRSGAAEPAGWAYPTGVLVRVLAEQGKFKEAQSALDEVPEPWPRHLNSFALLTARVALRCAQSRDDEALADVASALALNPFPRAITPFSVSPNRDIALVLERLGRSEDALSLAEAELSRARDFGSPRTVGLALRAMALLERGETGIALAREATDVLAPSGARLDHANALVALGMLLRRDGQRVAAREPLRRGLDLARRCGAVPLADFARQELITAGARPRRDALEGRDSLTAAELRVAQLAGGGATNREIAQNLYLSQKTVEMHLSRVYRKLAIASRTDLASALTTTA